MSHCSKCQMPLEAGSRFCGICGTASPQPAGLGSVVDTLRTPAPPAQSPATPPVATSPVATSPVAMAPVATPPERPSAKSYLPSGSANLFRSEDPYIGATLNNRFVIESKLGEGGFGAVYKGIQKGSNRIVALKLLHPEMTRDKNVVQRFRLEGQVLCRLKDAHTVTTYDFDQTEDGTLFIAMELLEGRSLHDVFSTDAPIPWQRMLKILSEMCSSLGEAHAMGIVHRDLKPENVHLERRSGNDEFVKILDFGIAKMLRGDGIGGTGGPQLTATGQTLGTLEYMSPEQLMGKELDGRSDIYGLGVLAYELMTGRLPFPEAIGPAMLISAQLKKIPESLLAALPDGDFPAEVEVMLRTMLQKMREDRFLDVAALRQECLRILANDAGATPEAVVEHASAPVAFPPSPQVQTPVARPMPEVLGAGAVSGPGPSTRAIIAATAPKTNALWLVALFLVAAGVAVYLLA